MENWVVMKAFGRLAWINQHRTLDDDVLIERARQVKGVIVKWYLDRTTQLLRANDILYGVEDYFYPDRWELAAQGLASRVHMGARFIVINAEVEWDKHPNSGPQMYALLRYFEDECPGVEKYASVDTRGSRMESPHQQVMLNRCQGYMPMVYPKAFYPNQGAGYVGRAFRASLDGKDFKGLPVMPTIQTYDDIGAVAVDQQIMESEGRECPGINAYTMAHATQAEWDAFRHHYVLPDPLPPPIEATDEIGDEMIEIVQDKETSELFLVDAASMTKIPLDEARKNAVWAIFYKDKRPWRVSEGHPDHLKLFATRIIDASY